MDSRRIDKNHPFYYGIRRKVSYDTHGKPLYDETPLQQADFLDPTEDDVFELGASHEKDVAKVLYALQVHLRYNQLAYVGRDIKIRWSLPGLCQPRADIVVAVSDNPRSIERKIFDVERWGAPPQCIIEIVSPRFVEADLVDKVEIYCRGGVQEYLIVDPGLRENDNSLQYHILGYQLKDKSFHPIEAEQGGGIRSATTQILLSPTPSRDSFQILDGRTKQPIDGADIVEQDRIAQIQGGRRASDITSALDFLRD